VRSVGLITDPSVTLETFRAALHGTFELEPTLPNGLAVTDGEEVLWLDALGGGCKQYKEYDPGELDNVGLDRMVFFDLRYHSIAFLKRILLAIADDRRIWVDNDDGMIVPGPELVARLQREPDWLMGLPTVTGD
jgi:hypothetical protein